MRVGKRSGEEAGCNLHTMLVEEDVEMLWLVEVREGGRGLVDSGRLTPTTHLFRCVII